MEVLFDKKQTKKTLTFNNLALEDRYGPGVLNFKVGALMQWLRLMARAGPPAAGKGKGRSFLYRYERNGGFADALISDLQPPEP